MESNTKECCELKIGEKIKRNSPKIKSEKGYLLLSTLFMLILSGIITQSIIKISTNHIIQLNQLSDNYQAKTALNMAENMLHCHILNGNQLLKKGKIVSSVGEIEVKRKNEIEYELILTQKNNRKLSQMIEIETDLLKESDSEKQELSNEDFEPVIIKKK